MKDTFVEHVEVDGKDESDLRWFLAVLPRMRIGRLGLVVSAATGDFQEQLFFVLKCRQLTVTLIESAAIAVHSDDIVSLLFREKSDVDGDAPSDVVVGPHNPGTHSGYERSLYMTAEHVGDGGVRQIVSALREVSLEAMAKIQPTSR